jgi:hypothetical protein
MITRMVFRKGSGSGGPDVVFESPLAHLRDVYLKWMAAYPPSTDLHCLLVIPLDSPTPGFKLKYFSISIEKVALSEKFQEKISKISWPFSVLSFVQRAVL